MKNPHDIIVRPRITERTMMLSYGNERLAEDQIQRKYTFEVAKDANKLEIKAAIEAIYNEGKKKNDQLIVVDSVRTIILKGKTRRVGQRAPGKRPDRKKAIVTLAKGQRLEDYGV
jgi:large subunit ribosomal protein L23